MYRPFQVPVLIVTLHQTVIGLEAENRWLWLENIRYGDCLLRRIGFNFHSILRHNILEGKKKTLIAAEPQLLVETDQRQVPIRDESATHLYCPCLRWDTISYRPISMPEDSGITGQTIVHQLLKDRTWCVVWTSSSWKVSRQVLCLQKPKVFPTPNPATPLQQLFMKQTNKSDRRESHSVSNLSDHGLIDVTAYDQYLQGNLRVMIDGWKPLSGIWMRSVYNKIPFVKTNPPDGFWSGGIFVSIYTNTWENYLVCRYSFMWTFTRLLFAEVASKAIGSASNSM